MNKKKTIVVTGATKGLGLAISSELVSSGYQILGFARSMTAEFRQLIEENPERVFFAELDLSNLESIEQNSKKALKQCAPIYGLVNNAGVGLDGVLATMHQKDVLTTMNTNLVGTILLTKQVVKRMLAASCPGSIVNISSIIANTGFNGLSVYAASKAGLVGFTKSLARELGKADIRVNAVSPGYMETEMTEGLEEQQKQAIVRRSPLGRLARTIDVAKIVRFLISEDSSSTTGQNFVVDAGSTS